MNIHGILRQAWGITTKLPILWVFGLLVALSMGGGSSQIDRDMLPPAWQAALVDFSSRPVFIPLTAIGLIGLSLALVQVGAVGDAALIAAVIDLRAGIGPTWSRGFAHGRRHMFHVWCLRLIAGLPYFLLLMAGMWSTLNRLIGLEAIGPSEGQAILNSWLCCLVPCWPLGLLILIIATGVETFALRVSVVENQGVWASMVRGWRLLTTEFWRIAGFWLYIGAVGLVLGLISVIPLWLGARILAPLRTASSSSASSMACLWGGTVIVWLVWIAFHSMYQVFMSVYWTLVYEKLKGERDGVRVGVDSGEVTLPDDAPAGDAAPP